jgi:hypothetical protein
MDLQCLMQTYADQQSRRGDVLRFLYTNRHQRWTLGELLTDKTSRDIIKIYGYPDSLVAVGWINEDWSKYSLAYSASYSKPWFIVFGDPEDEWNPRGHKMISIKFLTIPAGANSAAVTLTCGLHGGAAP